LKAGQIVALICAILLLLPGGLFALVVIAFTKADYRLHLSTFETIADTAELWIPAGVILALAGLLFRVAFRRPPVPPMPNVRVTD
jgi:uncharacterized membrane protein YjjB (DUF3815 family)